MLDDWGRDVRIFVGAHKASEFPDDPGYVPLHLGKAISAVDLGIMGDDSGDNISALNPYFCEITGLYWIWKNVDADIVGLAHYRRHFLARDRAIPFKSVAIAASSDFEEIGPAFDMILAAPVKFVLPPYNLPVSNETQYSSTAIGLDLLLVREALVEIERSYVDCFDFVMRDNTCSLCNMMIGRKVVCDAYCEWLFAILFKLEPWIPYRTYDPYQARVFGFIAERLLNVWVAKNRRHFRIGYRAIAQID